MLLYCKGGVAIATHADDQNVPASAYGEGVRIIPVASRAGLVRVGDPPAAGVTDLRPYAEPASTPDLLKVYAADLKWRKATGGVTVAGHSVASDDNAQSKIANAKTAFDNGTLTGTIPFKTLGGFIDADAATVTAIYAALVAHVQASYAAEQAAAAAIDAGTAATFDAVDALFAAL
jgi:hypothetical protein